MNLAGGFLLTLGSLIAIPLLLWLPQLLNWIAGVKLVPRWLPLALLPLTSFAGSLYLDQAGVVRPAKILRKHDDVRVNYDGAWHRTLALQVVYETQPDQYPQPLGLGIDAVTYDTLRVGQTVEVRTLELGRFIKFARLKDRSTLGFLRGLLPGRPRGPWQQATALVEQVTRVTYFASTESRTDLRWPYDVVQLNFTPAGKAEPIVAVDVIEAASRPGLTKGARVDIVWPADDPRAARIVGARAGSPLANHLYALGEAIGFAAIAIACFLLLTFLGSRRRNLKQALAEARSRDH